MGVFDKFRDGFKKTQDKLVHEIKRIVTFSPRMTEATLEELEVALIGADFGTEMTSDIVEAVRKAYETQGGGGLDVFGVARAELAKSLASSDSALRRNPESFHSGRARSVSTLSTLAPSHPLRLAPDRRAKSYSLPLQSHPLPAATSSPAPALLRP